MSRPAFTALCLAAAALCCGCTLDLERLPGRLVDADRASFLQGTFELEGARQHVTAGAGGVTLADDLDASRTGWADLLVANLGSQGSYRRASVLHHTAARPPRSGKPVQQKLPTIGASFGLVADLNSDGAPDLVFSSWRDDAGFDNPSYVYWNKGGKFSAQGDRRQELPTTGALGLSAADLNADGHLDLVVSCSFSSSKKTNEINSHIYWGGGSGLKKRAEVPTWGATGNAVADLDADGHLDLIFGSLQRDKTRDVPSLIYWGAAGGKYAASRRAELPSRGAADVAVADLDRDGHLDVVITNLGYYNQDVDESYIYWGDGTRAYGKQRRTLLPTAGATGVSAADLNRDGHLELVISNSRTKDTPSYIYWGPWSRGARAKNLRLDIKTKTAFGNLAADLDRDGHPEVLFVNFAGNVSDLYSGPWTRRAGTSAKVPAPLDSSQGYMSVGQDPGAVSDRRARGVFTSRALDTGMDDPRYGLLSVKATVPSGARLKLQLRAASTAADLASAAWTGPKSATDSFGRGDTPLPERGLDSRRYIQYRAVLENPGFGPAPTLHRVEISYR